MCFFSTGFLDKFHPEIADSLVARLFLSHLIPCCVNNKGKASGGKPVTACRCAPEPEGKKNLAEVGKWGCGHLLTWQFRFVVGSVHAPALLDKPPAEIDMFAAVAENETLLTDVLKMTCNGGNQFVLKVSQRCAEKTFDKIVAVMKEVRRTGCPMGSTMCAFYMHSRVPSKPVGCLSDPLGPRVPEQIIVSHDLHAFVAHL